MQDTEFAVCVPVQALYVAVNCHGMYEKRLYLFALICMAFNLYSNSF